MLYFQHDINAAFDDKILQLRAQFGHEGYAYFWYCIESMAKNDGLLMASLIAGLSVGYGIDEAKLTKFLEHCIALGLFTKTEGAIIGYRSPRLDKHLTSYKARSLHGKKGAKVRWKNEHSPAIAPPLPEQCPPQCKDKIREDKIREDILPAVAGDDYSFNKQTKKMFDDTDKRMPIIAYYWSIKGFAFPTRESYSAALRRELRAVGAIVGYERDRIKKTCEWLQANADFKWTLETVHKFIDEPLENLKAGGKKITDDDILKEITGK